MAPRLWDPYRVLNITARDSNWMHCVGHVASHDGARCRWKIQRDDFHEVISILDKMETKPPSEISSKTLSRLARLSLCENYHQNQKDCILDEWDEEIEAATKQYDRLEKWKTRCKELSAQNTKLNARLEELSLQDDGEDSEAERRAEEVSERLKVLLNSEHEAFQVYKKDAEAAQKRQGALEGDLRSKLAEADKLLAKQQDDIQSMTRKEVDLVTKTRNLTRNLVLERRKVESSIKDMEKMKDDLSSEVERVQTQLSTKQHTLETTRKLLSEAKMSEESALKGVENLRSQIADERANYYGLHAELKAARAQELSLQGQLSRERRELGQVKKDLGEVETTRAAMYQEAESFRSQVEREQQKSEQLSDTLSSEVRDLQSQLAAERENADRMARQLSSTKDEKMSLAAQFSRECQTSSRLRTSLDQVKAERISLAGQTEDLKSKLQAEHQNCEEFRNELDATKAQEVAVTKRLEEQVAVAAAIAAASSAEKARLLDQIAKLERHSLSKIFSTFWDKLKIIMTGAVSLLGRARWRRQVVAGVGAGVDTV